MRNAVLNLVGRALVDVVGPMLMIILMLESAQPLVPPSISSQIALPYIIGAIYIITFGSLIRKFKVGEPVRDFIKTLGAIIILDGAAYLFTVVSLSASLLLNTAQGLASAGMWSQGLILYSIGLLLYYAPVLSNPLIYASIVLIIVLGFRFFTFYEPLRPVAIDLPSNSSNLALAVFFATLLYSLSEVPLIRPYSPYTVSTSIVILLFALASVGFRLYTSYLRVGEKSAINVYNQYASSIQAVNDDNLYNAVKEFMISGNKDALLNYINQISDECPRRLRSRIKQIASRLMEYSPPYYGGLWPWELGNVNKKAASDAEFRKQIITESINAVSSCRSAKAASTVMTPTISQAAPPFITTEDGTRVYASEEELAVRPLEEKSGETVVKADKKPEEDKNNQ